MPRESHLSIRVSSEEKVALQKLAELQDVSLGQLVRRALLGLPGDPAPPGGLLRPLPSGVFSASARNKEIGWLQTHAQRLQLEIPGHWVILAGDEMIAHGSDYLATLAEARQKGVGIPFVERIPDRSGGVWMGP